MPDTPSQFDWVTARSKCSLQVVFKELHDGVQNDVATANAVASRNGQIRFAVTTLQQRRFSVVREDGQIPESVEFSLERTGIILVRYTEQDKTLQAGISFNPDGSCMITLDGKELYQWQFRRMALERLFFAPPSG